MLSLIKIRVKYIIRKPCLLFWTYLFIPIIILIAAIIIIPKKKKLTLKSFDPFIFNQNHLFFNSDKENDYLNIKVDLQSTTFFVDNENYCSTIISLLNEYGVTESETPLCTDKESNLIIIQEIS